MNEDEMIAQLASVEMPDFGAVVPTNRNTAYRLPADPDDVLA